MIQKTPATPKLIKNAQLSKDIADDTVGIKHEGNMSGSTLTAGSFSYSSYFSPDTGLITEPTTGEFIGLDFENPPEGTTAPADVPFKGFEIASARSATLMEKANPVPIEQPITIWMELAYPRQPFQFKEEIQGRVQRLAAQLDRPEGMDPDIYFHSLFDERKLKIVEALGKLGPAARTALPVLLSAHSTAESTCIPDRRVSKKKQEILDRFSGAIATTIRTKIFPNREDYIDAVFELTRHEEMVTRLLARNILVKSAAEPYKRMMETVSAPSRPKDVDDAEWAKLKRLANLKRSFPGDLHESFVRRVIKMLVTALGDEDIVISKFSGDDLQREYFRRFSFPELRKTVSTEHTDVNGERIRIKAIEVLRNIIQAVRMEHTGAGSKRRRLIAIRIDEPLNAGVSAIIKASRSKSADVQRAAREALRAIDPEAGDPDTINLSLKSIKEQGDDARQGLPELLLHSLQTNDIKQRSAGTTPVEEALVVMYPDLGERVAALSEASNHKRELVRLGALQELAYIFRYIFQTDVRTKIAAETASWSEGERKEFAIQIARALIISWAAMEPAGRSLFKDLRQEFRSYTADDASLAHVPQMAIALLELMGEKVSANRAVEWARKLEINDNPALCVELKPMADRFEKSKNSNVKRLCWSIQAGARNAQKPASR